MVRLYFLTMHTSEAYMQRCIELAMKGAGHVSPNPMVGAVLVAGERIIGEGWHREYGQAHAEVNCIGSVAPADRHLVSQSTLFVSLEPCAHFGRTPPCADLIVQHRIPKVVVGCTDTFSQVSGRGIARLQAAGVDVVTGVLEQGCRYLNRRFFTRQERGRPYVVLKWAQSEDGFLGPEQGRKVMLSNSFSRKMAHRMRSEEDAILVGFRTALLDNPLLSNRYGSGKQPLRIAVDPGLQLPQHLHLFDRQQPTLVFNTVKDEEQEQLRLVRVNGAASLPQQILHHLEGINSLIVEGGSKTLQLFIDAGLWDEATVIRTPHLLGGGTAAPVLRHAVKTAQYNLYSDQISIYRHEDTRRLYPEK